MAENVTSHSDSIFDLFKMISPHNPPDLQPPSVIYSSMSLNKSLKIIGYIMDSEVPQKGEEKMNTSLFISLSIPLAIYA